MNWMQCDCCLFVTYLHLWISNEMLHNISFYGPFYFESCTFETQFLDVYVLVFPSQKCNFISHSLNSLWTSPVPSVSLKVTFSLPKNHLKTPPQVRSQMSFSMIKFFFHVRRFVSGSHFWIFPLILRIYVGIRKDIKCYVFFIIRRPSK